MKINIDIITNIIKTYFSFFFKDEDLDILLNHIYNLFRKYDLDINYENLNELCEKLELPIDKILEFFKEKCNSNNEKSKKEKIEIYTNKCLIQKYGNNNIINPELRKIINLSLKEKIDLLTNEEIEILYNQLYPEENIKIKKIRTFHL